MKIFLSLVCLVFSISGFSQDSTGTVIHRTFISLSVYKELGKPLTKQDSLNFKFINGDTLVLMPEGWVDEKRPNEVEVEYEPQNPIFLEKYKKVAFRNEKEPMKIWKDDIKIFFDTTVPLKHKAALLDFASGISASVDSLQIREVPTREESNYFVYYGGKGNSPENIPEMSNRQSEYYLYWNHKQQITSATLMVDPEIVKTSVYQLANLKIQFFRSLGHFKWSKSFECNSYLSNCRNIRSLTDIDMQILKYHYSYAVCKGVTKKAFENFHHHMTETLRKEPNAKIVVIHDLNNL